MTDVRNQRLAILVSTAATFYSLFRVPAGWVCILKEILYHNNSGATVHINLWLNAENKSLWVVNQDLTAYQPGRWSGAVAMNPSDYLTTQTSAANTGIWCSGALLAGGPPWPVLPTVLLDPNGQPLEPVQ